jgi:hypothetical protein
MVIILIAQIVSLARGSFPKLAPVSFGMLLIFKGSLPFVLNDNYSFYLTSNLQRVSIPVWNGEA